jgi:hypothetical protein
MAEWDQYEVWVEKRGKWELVASFREFAVASAVARNYSYRMRLIHAHYDNDKLLRQDVIAEVGTTREHP